MRTPSSSSHSSSVSSPPSCGRSRCSTGARAARSSAAAGSETVNVEPSPGSEIDVDAPAGLGDDPVHGRQPEPGAEADVLGRVERLEDPLEHVAARCPVPVSDDREPHVLVAARRSRSPACRRSGIASRALIARLMITCSSCARSASTGGRSVAGEHRDLDRLADQPPEHRHQPARDLVDVEQHRLEHLPAGEREQLARQLAPPARPRAAISLELARARARRRSARRAISP